MSRRPTLFIALFVALIMLPSVSQAIESKKKVLPSELAVIHVERHNLPLVMVRLLVKASPLNETANKAGLAYMTAALMDEGTTTRTSSQISEEIEFIGASLSAGADMDYSVIDLSVLKKDIDKGFELFSDILLNPAFSDTEIQRKKDLIKGNLKQSEESPGFHSHRAFRKALYGDYPYGRIIQGSTETIDSITRDNIIKFHSSFFVPNNSILTVVGDITEQELSVLLDKYLSSWKKSDVPSSPGFTPKTAKKELISIDKELTQATISLGHIGIKRGNPDYYALSLMNYILGGGGFSSRLMQVIRDKMGLAYSVYSYFTPNKEPGLFMVEVQTKNESANTVIEEIIKGMNNIRDEEVSFQELEDAKSFLTGSFAGRLDTMRKIADFLPLTEFYGLGLDYIEKYPKFINSVTTKDIQRVAKKYLTTENYILVVVAKQSKANINK